MRGQAPLIVLRRRGFTPPTVWIDATGADGLQRWRDWHHHRPLQPHVDIDPADTVARLDLRFLHGVPAVLLDVDASDVGRQASLIDAIQAEGVRRIAVTLVDLETLGHPVTDVFLVDAEVAHG